MSNLSNQTNKNFNKLSSVFQKNLYLGHHFPCKFWMRTNSLALSIWRFELPRSKIEPRTRIKNLKQFFSTCFFTYRKTETKLVNSLTKNYACLCKQVMAAYCSVEQTYLLSLFAQRSLLIFAQQSLLLNAWIQPKEKSKL